MVGGLDPATLDWLKARRNIEPVSAEIAVQDGIIVGQKAQRHASRGDALPEQVWEALVDLLGEPLAVLFDTRSGKLLYILPEASARRPQLAVEVNYAIKKPKQTLNLIVSAYRPRLEDIRAAIKGGDLLVIRGEIA